MTSELTSLAVSVVRVWTRAYTCGLPPAERTARQAEVDSDLWEFEHDPEAPHGAWAAAHVLVRLLMGIKDDLAWRLDAGPAAAIAPVRALAAAGMVTGPRRVSALGLAALVHFVAISATASLVDGVPARNGRALVAARAGVERPSINESSWGRLVRRGAKVTVVETTRAVGAVRAAAFAVSGGLITQPPVAAQAPPSLDRFVAKLLQSRYSLSVRRGQFAGTGASVLQSAIVQSRFVLVGEYHGLAQTPEFASAVCNAAGPERFHAMAVEEGAVAAAALESLARRADGLVQLAAFEKTFPQSFNVSSSREEYAMLQECARVAQGPFRVWGLNQEGLGAAGLILSRILESPLGGAARRAMQQLVQKNDEAYRKSLQSGSAADLFMLSADDRDLARGAAALQQDGSPEARSLFAWLIESHEINRVSPTDYDNARRRERLMKTRFAADYTRAPGTTAAPRRVLLKFGAYHVYRGSNPVRGLGIGNYVAELAEGEGAQSLHLSLMPVRGSQPIHPKVGEPAQFIPFNLEDDPGWRYLRPMMSNRLQADWTLFDLRPLRHDFQALMGGPNPDLAALVFGIDMLVLVPESTPATGIH